MAEPDLTEGFIAELPSRTRTEVDVCKVAVEFGIIV